jgi:hypothetical protein
VASRDAHSPTSASSTRAKAQALQAEQASAERRRSLVIGAGVLVAMALVAVGVVAAMRSTADPTPTTSPSGESQQVVPSTPSGATTVEQSPSTAVPPPGIEGLLAWDTTGYPGDGAPHPGSLAHDHVPGPVTYAVTPPVGGPHAPVWMNAGVYTAPVPSERGVHDLEHGAVWITYSPTLSASDVVTLTAFVSAQTLIPETGSEAAQPGQSNRYIVMSPWSDASLPSPIVISSWGYQLRVSSPTDSRLQQFVDTFRASKQYSPEFGSPVDGVPIETGGRAASDGGTVANPPGAAQ